MNCSFWGRGDAGEITNDCRGWVRFRQQRFPGRAVLPGSFLCYGYSVSFRRLSHCRDCGIHIDAVLLDSISLLARAQAVQPSQRRMLSRVDAGDLLRSPQRGLRSSPRWCSQWPIPRRSRSPGTCGSYAAAINCGLLIANANAEVSLSVILPRIYAVRARVCFTGHPIAGCGQHSLTDLVLWTDCCGHPASAHSLILPIIV